ncbi:hypothetical protein HU200_040469 [Digitaria exilis]|uniref:GDSL esterase/lipase n=1 Tax=Digitaria exilis TaxID=1010633 RepID=A0A835B8W9_9POAL|nr:hypothetical protein HU200_040469 [Digitaria exilis]
MSTTLRHSLLPIILLQLHVALLSGEPAAAAKVPAVIVFGDSTVDTGNNNYISTLLKSDFSPYGRDLRVGPSGGQPTGRFSNGRLAVDFISEAFGLPPLVPAYLDPNADMASLSTGACFASAGAGYDNATSDLFSVLPVWKQLEYFKEYVARLRSFQGDAKAKETLSEALYIVSMGTNDYLENYYAMPSGHAARSATSASEYAGYLLGVAESFARALHALGARKLDLNGLPPMGCLPLERHVAPGGTCTEEYNVVARSFNDGLRDLVARLDAAGEVDDGGLGDGARVVYGDVYGPVEEVVADPGAHGFEVVGVGCCGATGRFEMGYMCNSASPLTCEDAGKYAFWDAIHPTERLHRFLADRKMNTTLYVFL